jgi:hypothetical protein
MTDDSISTPNRRRFVQIGGGVLLAGLAGCAGQGGSSEATATETGMDDGTMTESGMDDDTMTESGMDDDTMTESGMDDDTMTESGMDGEESMAQGFRIRIENVSTGNTLQTMDGSVAVPLSPGAFTVHTEPGALFSPGEPASEGLERIAEDGTPGTLVESLGGMEMSGTVGAFDTPAGTSSAGPLMPGDVYEFEFTAAPDARLSFATMFVQSNDLFYAPGPEGIALFEDGEPVDSDVTDRVMLWDAGTEVNEEPGTGPNQAPRQSAADTGDDENDTVRPISAVDDGFSYPAVTDVIAVTVTPTG